MPGAVGESRECEVCGPADALPVPRCAPASSFRLHLLLRFPRSICPVLLQCTSMTFLLGLLPGEAEEVFFWFDIFSVDQHACQYMPQKESSKWWSEVRLSSHFRPGLPLR